jgi:hypothetical protein
MAPESADAIALAALGQPVDAQTFVATLRSKLEAALAAFDADVPHNPNVKLLRSKQGKGRIVLSPSNPYLRRHTSTNSRRH